MVPEESPSKRHNDDNTSENDLTFRVDDFFTGKVIKAIVREGNKVIIKTEEGLKLVLTPSFSVDIIVPEEET